MDARTRSPSLRVVIAILTALWLLGVVTLASAHHKAGHQHGGGSTNVGSNAGGYSGSNAGGNSGGNANANGGGGSSVTEDNDGDGYPNTPDPQGNADNQHPSGKDKHAEAGGSGNQGKTQADPDNGSNGGVDQPGGSGGNDQLDQDGNNGCGNDDDFEDDNNGNCGGVGGGPPPPPGGNRPPGEEHRGPGPRGRGVARTRHGAVAAVQVVAPPAPQAVQESVAFTGFDVWPVATAAVLLTVMGVVFLALGRRRAAIER